MWISREQLNQLEQSWPEIFIVADKTYEIYGPQDIHNMEDLDRVTDATVANTMRDAARSCGATFPASLTNWLRHSVLNQVPFGATDNQLDSLGSPDAAPDLAGTVAAKRGTAMEWFSSQV